MVKKSFMWIFLVPNMLVVSVFFMGGATTCSQPISKDKVEFCELLCESQAKVQFPPDIERGAAHMYSNIALNREYSRSCLLACILGEEKKDD